MNGLGYLFLCLIFGLPAIGGLVSMWSTARRRRHELRLRRLDVLQEALRHPQLDETTRREVVRVLGAEHRWFTWAQLLRGGYVLYLTVSWLLLVAGGGGWIYFEIVGGSWRQIEPLVAMTVLGFGLLTLPFALRELLGRTGRSASVAR
jgi:hypothetical protein